MSSKTAAPVAPKAGSVAVTPAQKAAALAGARDVVRRIGRLKSLKNESELVNLFSNRSAGTVGLIMSIAGKLAIAVTEVTAKKMGQAPNKQEMQKMNDAYAALEKRWGIAGEMPKKPMTSLPPAIAKNGRGFLADMISVMSKISGPDKTGASTGLGSKSVPSLTESDITYTVLSPTRVLLMRKKKAGKEPGMPLYAVLEDKQWRLDLGDLLAPPKKTEPQKAR